MASFKTGPLFWAVAALASVAQAKDVVYNWNLTWVNASPDGFNRPIIGINNQWPLPPLTAEVGDHVHINVQNHLGNQTSSLHFHGLFMNGSNHMDGPSGVTQCSIPIGGSYTYDFNITQPGTYWYHSHNDGQYPDGLRGPLVITDPKDPYKDQYDEEMVLTLSDWYHDQMTDLLPKFISVTNPTGAEPVPDAALMNDTQNLAIKVQPGKTYKFRIVNMAAFAGQYLWFEGHTMRIVEVDGVYTNPAEADMIYVTAAQRYSVLVTMHNSTDSNFAVNGAMDQDLFDTVPDGLNTNVTSWLVYDEAKPNPDPTPVDSYAPFDDMRLTPQDGLPLWDHFDHNVELDFQMGDLSDGANYAFFNGITYTSPKVPTLYTALTSGSSSNNSQIYGSATNTFVLAQNEIVQIVVNSNDPGKHPFHLHGHNFQVIARSDDDAGAYDPTSPPDFPAVPMRRDTIMVNPNGNIVLRYKADNPGVWLFHCHIEWHMDTGLVATMVEAPLALQAQYPQGIDSLPADHIDACKAQGKPYQGNAAGNTVNLLDLSGENLPVAPLPEGFTARGIVALVFSCISAFLGMAAIVWYGSGEIKQREQRGVAEGIAGESVGVTEPARDQGVMAPTVTLMESFGGHGNGASSGVAS